MIIYLAWFLIGSSIFLASFYLSIYSGKVDREIEPLDYEPSITLLMPAYNEGDLIEDSVGAALDIDYGNYEVILVDDGSSDNTFEEAKKFDDDRLTVIKHDENQGKAAALNTALENADTEYSVVLDADSVIDGELLERSVARMEGDSSLGGVIASIMPLSRDSFVRRLQVVEYRITNFYRRLMAEVDTLDVTPGAFSIYRTQDLKDVGGFDEGNLTEDIEMAWRLRKHGKSLSMEYQTRSRTELPEGFYSLYRQRVRWARGFMYNARKHRDLFFDKDLGWFARFQLPMHGLMPALAIIGLLMAGYGLGERLYNFIIRTSAVGLVIPSFENLSLLRALLTIQWKIYLPLAISLLATAFIIRSAYEQSGEEVEHYSQLVFYLVGFFAVKGFFWTAAILKEMMQTKRVWT